MKRVKTHTSTTGIPFPGFNEAGASVVNAALAAGVAENLAVPTDARVCQLWSDSDITYNFDVTAAAISDVTTNRGVSAGIPREIVISDDEVTNISVFSESAAAVVAQFWK